MFSEVLLRDIMVKKSGDNMERENWQLLLKAEGHNIAIFVKWMVIALVVGVLVGFIGVGFSYALKGALNFRMDHSWIVYFLPLGGLGIVWLYHSAGVKQSKGTNLVITHLFGGSAGREGAALQLGGSLAHQLGRWWKLNDKDIHIITMCGMSAAFSALFGTAVTAAVFPLEVISVGIMYYAALGRLSWCWRRRVHVEKYSCFVSGGGDQSRYHCDALCADCTLVLSAYALDTETVFAPLA